MPDDLPQPGQHKSRRHCFGFGRISGRVLERKGVVPIEPGPILAQQRRESCHQVAFWFVAFVVPVALCTVLWFSYEEVSEPFKNWSEDERWRIVKDEGGR